MALLMIGALVGMAIIGAVGGYALFKSKNGATGGLAGAVSGFLGLDWLGTKVENFAVKLVAFLFILLAIYIGYKAWQTNNTFIRVFGTFVAGYFAVLFLFSLNFVHTFADIGVVLTHGVPPIPGPASMYNVVANVVTNPIYTVGVALVTGGGIGLWYNSLR